MDGTSDRKLVNNPSHPIVEPHITVISVSGSHYLGCHGGQNLQTPSEARDRGHFMHTFSQRFKSAPRTKKKTSTASLLPALHVGVVQVPIYLPSNTTNFESCTSSQSSSSIISSAASLVELDHRSPYAFTDPRKKLKKPSECHNKQSCYVMVGFSFMSLTVLILVLIYLSLQTKMMREGIADY